MTCALLLFQYSVTVFLDLLISGKHRFYVRSYRMAECCQIDVHKQKRRKEEKQKYMDRIHNLYASQDIDPALEGLHVPQQEARPQLQGDQEHHDRKICQLLHRIELVVGSAVVGILLSQEQAVSIVSGLLHAAGDEFPDLKRRQIDPYFPGDNIEDHPDEEVEDQQKPDLVVDVDRCPEFHQTKQLPVPDLQTCEYQYKKACGVDPVPYPYRQWMQIYLFHLLSPLLIPFNLFASRMGDVSILKVIWSIGTDIPPKIISTPIQSSTFSLVLPRT